jgi:DNA-binding GntR family transcriptional regulator
MSAEFDERATSALAEQMEAQAKGDLVAARDAHERFHFALYEASGRAWLVRSILPAWRNSERYRVAALRSAATSIELAAQTLKEEQAAQTDVQVGKVNAR